MIYPLVRARRLRRKEGIRRLIRDVYLDVNSLVMPFFVREGRNVKKRISSMPGVYQFSLDFLLREIEKTVKLGIPAILLFGIPAKKDKLGTQAYARDGIIQKAVRRIKKNFPELVVITDVCLCEYTSSGHCGVIKKIEGRRDVDNDSSLRLLARTALSCAEAGADIVAPSSMMDGQVKVIREVLDKNGFSQVAIMSYSVKYASGFYGPFREAAQSSPQCGKRFSYQEDFRVSWEALKEAGLDLAEGADILMVKPALCYLDIIRVIKDNFALPLAAYNVSGEYSLIKAASAQGWIEEKRIVWEVLMGIKRAGADIIITYFARDVASWLKDR